MKYSTSKVAQNSSKNKDWCHGQKKVQDCFRLRDAKIKCRVWETRLDPILKRKNILKTYLEQLGKTERRLDSRWYCIIELFLIFFRGKFIIFGVYTGESSS